MLMMDHGDGYLELRLEMDHGPWSHGPWMSDDDGIRHSHTSD